MGKNDYFYRDNVVSKGPSWGERDYFGALIAGAYRTAENASIKSF
jgi:hypothetical protein